MQDGNLSSVEINVKSCQLLPRHTGSQILSRVCSFCEVLELQNQGKQDNKRKQKRPFFWQLLENTTAGCFNKCLKKKKKASPQAVYFFDSGKKHWRKLRNQIKECELDGRSKFIWLKTVLE